MTKLFEVYKCDVCGNTVMVVGASGGTMVCCGKPMISSRKRPLTRARRSMCR